jgi:hypothetical protein
MLRRTKVIGINGQLCGLLAFRFDFNDILATAACVVLTALVLLRNRARRLLVPTPPPPQSLFLIPSADMSNGRPTLQASWDTPRSWSE